MANAAAEEQMKKATIYRKRQLETLFSMDKETPTEFLENALKSLELCEEEEEG